MAIYSFNHDTFGKSAARKRGSKPYAAANNARYNGREAATRYAEQDGTAASNAAYNVREEVTYAVRAHIIPTDPEAAAKWFRKQEAGERANARMSDRFIGALPRELTPEQCIEAVEGFCRTVTQDRVPWHFGLHLELEEKGSPNWNPHAHIIFRDRDTETGKRFLYTTAGNKERRQLEQKGAKAWSTQDFRAAWQDHMNAALERGGHDVRIDARSNKARGIEAEPGVHTGRAAQRLLEKGQKPETTPAYAGIDNGTRLDENERRKRRRSERPPPDTPDEQHRQALNERHGEQRSALASQHHAERMALRTLHGAEFATRTHQENLHTREQRNAAYADIGQQYAAKYQEARRIAERHQREAALAALTVEQTAAYEARAKQLVVNASPAKDTRWREMKAVQATERIELESQQKREVETLQAAQVAERTALMELQRVAREATRAQGTAKQALRDAVALTGSQRMVNVEAVQMERMRRRAEQTQAQRDTTAKASEQADKASAVRAKLKAMREAGDAQRETTDRRARLAAKQAEQTARDASSQAKGKKKGRGDTEQER